MDAHTQSEGKVEVAEQYLMKAVGRAAKCHALTVKHALRP